MNSSFSIELKSDFEKLMKFCINNDRLILNLIGLFALKSYNDNHSKDMHIRIRLKRNQQGNSICEDHLHLVKRIPKVIQRKSDVSELRGIMVTKEVLDVDLKEIGEISGDVIELVQSESRLECKNNS